MKKLPISSPLNLHCHPKENISEYIKAGLLFHKEAGFEAADFSMGLLDLASDGWQPYAEQALADSKEVGVALKLCHLPFIAGGGDKNEEFMAIFDKKCTEPSMLRHFSE